MEKAHDGMTMQQLRALQFHLEALGLEEKYVELNGEMPLAADRWEPELDAREPEPWREMPSLDGWLDSGCSPYDDEDG